MKTNGQTRKTTSTLRTVAASGGITGKPAGVIAPLAEQVPAWRERMVRGAWWRWRQDSPAWLF